MSLLPDELRYGWLFLFRLIPALMLVPAFGGRWGGRVVQSAVSLLLAVSLIPALSRMSFAEVSQANLAAIAIKELMIGLAIGIVASIALHLAESFASFIGEPTALAEPHTTLHDVWGLLFVAIFFAVGGPHQLLRVLLESYRVFPLAAGVSEPTAASWLLRFASFFTLLVLALGPLFAVLLGTLALEAYATRVLFVGRGAWLGAAGSSYLVIAASALSLPFLFDLLARESLLLLRQLLEGG